MQVIFRLHRLHTQIYVIISAINKSRLAIYSSFATSHYHANRGNVTKTLRRFSRYTSSNSERFFLFKLGYIYIVFWCQNQAFQFSQPVHILHTPSRYTQNKTQKGNIKIKWVEEVCRCGSGSVLLSRNKRSRLRVPECEVTQSSGGGFLYKRERDGEKII